MTEISVKASTAARASQAPASVSAAAPAPALEPAVWPEHRIRRRSVTVDGASALVGALAGSLGLTWIAYERILPLTGALGFWLVWYAVFLALYGTVTSMIWGRRAVADRLAAAFMATIGLLIVFVIFDQIAYTIFRGSSAIQHSNFFTQTMALAGPLSPLSSGGVLHAMVGSLEQMGIATVIAVPLGILAFAVLTIGLPKSGFAAGLALTIMMIPFVARSSEVMLRLVPGNLREASYALGASQWRTVWTVVLPTARSGLTTAVVLGMARAIGETAPVLLTSGFSSFMNANPFSGWQTSLPLYIYESVRLPQQSEVQRAFGAALVLILVVLVLFTIARVLGGKPPGELTRRQRRRIARDRLAQSVRTEGDTHASA